MRIILNELSYDFPLQDQKKAKDCMSIFLKQYKNLKTLLKSDSVIMDRRYNYIQLSQNYNICQWRKDTSVDKEEIRMFSLLLDKAEIFDKADFYKGTGGNGDAEFVIGEKVSVACLIAYETEGVVLSFASDELWGKPVIKGRYYSYDEDKDDVVSQEAEVHNVSDDYTYEVFKIHYQQLPVEVCPVKTGSELWERRRELFPNLVFCESVENQLKDTQQHHVKQVFIKLTILQDYFSGCGPVFDSEQIRGKTTPESKKTLDDSAKEHTFKCPDGRNLLFSWHIRFTGNYPGRIFFYPDNPNKIGFIGHINGKL